jgi:hypothetical protein
MLSLVLLGFEAARDDDAGDGAALLRARVVRSLASLVEGAVAGLICDAALAGPIGAGLADIAEEAGCDFIEAPTPAEGLAAALARVRRTEVFLLNAGYAIDRSFIDEARDAAAFGGLAQPRALRLAPESLLTRLAPNLAPAVGVLARKDALAKAHSGDLPTLARRLHARELTVRARRCA